MAGLNIAELKRLAEQGDEDALLFTCWYKARRTLEDAEFALASAVETLAYMEDVLRQRVQDKQ